MTIQKNGMANGFRGLLKIYKSSKYVTPYNVGPPVISWFINPINDSCKLFTYNKP